MIYRSRATHGLYLTIVFFHPTTARLVKSSSFGTVFRLRAMVRRVLLLGLAANFCFSIFESTLPDPCPDDCRGVMTSRAGHEGTAQVTDQESSPQDSHRPAQCGSFGCHCADTHVTQIASPIDVPSVGVTFVSAPQRFHLDVTIDHGRAAPPVPPPLARI